MKLDECWAEPSIRNSPTDMRSSFRNRQPARLAKLGANRSRFRRRGRYKLAMVRCPSRNRFFIARLATEIFFPQRIALRIDGRSYSPRVLEKIMYCAGTQPAYHLASKSLDKVGGISITGRHVGNLAEGIGEELANLRDARTEAYFEQLLPRVPTAPSSPIPVSHRKYRWRANTDPRRWRCQRRARSTLA